MAWDLKVLVFVIAGLYAIVNLLVAKGYSTRQMVDEFVHGQCIIGLIFQNIFLAPAWALKGVRRFVVALVK